MRAVAVIGRYAIQRQYTVVEPNLNRGAWAELEPGGINQVSRQDRIDCEETSGRGVADALVSDNKLRLAPRKH